MPDLPGHLYLSWQSASESQRVLHAPFTHLRAFAHATVTDPQVPEPLQLGRISLIPSGAHIVFPQSVPDGACLHAPAPLHLPMRPQAVLSAVQVSTSLLPSGTFAHVPCAFLQLWHMPHEGLSQHVPSTHVRLAMHSVVAAQPEPLGFKPHEYEDPNTTQFEPALQSAVCVSGVHVDLQVALLESHKNSPHDCVPPIKHAPWPLQKPALLRVPPPLGHMATVHMVLGLQLLHPPWPLH